MDRLRRHISKRKRELWILAAVVCLAQMLPLHMHLHHSDNLYTAGATHAVDMHIADTAADHQHHDDAHVIDLSAETIVKSFVSDSLVSLLFIYLLTAFFLPSVLQRLPFPESTDRPPRYLFLIFSPLRAPPRT